MKKEALELMSITLWFNGKYKVDIGPTAGIMEVEIEDYHGKLIAKKEVGRDVLNPGFDLHNLVNDVFENHKVKK